MSRAADKPPGVAKGVAKGVAGGNRRKVLGFLYFYSDLWEIGSGDSSDTPAATPSESRSRPADTLLRGYIMARVDDRTEDPEAAASFDALCYAVDRLKRQRWELWMRIEPLYFQPDNNPSRLDYWYAEAGKNSTPAKLAIGQHDDAVSFIQREAERYLAERGYTHLVMEIPMLVRGNGARRVRRKRDRATELFVRHLAAATKQGLAERQARGRAVRLTARETGYSVQEVRTLARGVEREVEFKVDGKAEVEVKGGGEVG